MKSPVFCNVNTYETTHDKQTNKKGSYFSGWLGATSLFVSLTLSPLTIGLCRRKSTRLTAVIGGLLTALGCLFTSFATEFHQLFLSYGLIVGENNH